MCGRVALTASGEELADAFDLDDVPQVEPRYNIAPSQPVLVVRGQPGGGRRASSLRWGLARRGPLPEAATDEGWFPQPEGSSVGRKPAEPDARGLLINARSETALSKPSFREAFRSRRCLIPASGFYEWKKGRGRSQPFFVRLRSGSVFALAGIWEPPPEEAEPRASGSFVILTTEPNALILPIHDRMPVIVPPADYGAWLQAEASAARLRALLGPFPHDLLVAQPVGPAVNDARQEGPVCLDPPDPAERAQGRLFSDEPDAS